MRNPATSVIYSYNDASPNPKKESIMNHSASEAQLKLDRYRQTTMADTNQTTGEDSFRMKTTKMSKIKGNSPKISARSQLK